MFGLKLIKESEYDSLLKKGYYGETALRDNAYIRVIREASQRLELPPFLPIDREKIAELYSQQGVVNGVVSYIAKNVGDVAKYLYLYDKKSNEVIENHWILDLLNRPNDRYSLRKFMVAWATNKLLYGDAWVYAPKAVGRDRGIVKEMYVIPSHRVGVEWGKGNTDSPLEGIRLLGSMKERMIKFEDVFESFDYNLDELSMFGTSKIVAAAEYLSVMDKGVRRQDTALSNGGVATIITPKQDTVTSITRPADADQLEREMNNADAVNKTKVVRTPIETHTLGNAPVDLNILESHKEAVTLLCFAYQIPVDLYYGQSKYENAKEAKKTIYEQNAIPMCNEFAEDLLVYLGLSNEFAMEVDTQKIDVLQEKPADTLVALEKMNASINEKREVMGYEPLEDEYASKPMIPLGVQFGYDEDSYDIQSE